jgi:hypothetical protein
MNRIDQLNTAGVFAFYVLPVLDQKPNHLQVGILVMDPERNDPGEVKQLVNPNNEDQSFWIKIPDLSELEYGAIVEIVPSPIPDLASKLHQAIQELDAHLTPDT